MVVEKGRGWNRAFLGEKTEHKSWAFNIMYKTLALIFKLFVTDISVY